MAWPRDLEFCILDFETTGLYPQFGDRIVEYAFVVVKKMARLLIEEKVWSIPTGR